MTDDTPEPENEITAAARDAKQASEGAKDTPDPAERSWTLATKIGVGVGIGSAALAAAMLYANRSKKK